MALPLWPQVQICFKTRHIHSLFFQEFISQIKGHTIFWFIFAKELIEFRKKTAEFEAADNGLNAYYKNDTGA